MPSGITMRVMLGAVGAFGGLALWALWKIFDVGMVSDRVALMLAAFVAAGLAAHLAMSGPLAQKQAMARALMLGAGVGLLITLAAFRYDNVADTQPISVALVVVIFHLSLPFLISQGMGRGFRHYPTLFIESWALFERIAAAWICAGLTWAVIYLSDLVLGLVGFALLDTISRIEPLAPMITGLALGLGLAVMLEIGGEVVSRLILGLLRLLVPVLLAVVGAFLIALPFQGFEAVFGNYSAGSIFLALALAMATLTTAALGRDATDQVPSPALTLAARALALLLPVPAALAGWALYLRVTQYGWTPERLGAALFVALGLAYGASYAVSALSLDWAARLRRSNVMGALTGLVAMALWVGLLPTESISSHSVIARYEAGETGTADLDIYALGSWGRPGAVALDTLRARAKAGDAELAALLNGDAVAPDAAEISGLRADLKAGLTVQPAGASATRDAFIDLAPVAILRDWQAKCQDPPDAALTCVVVIGDFLTDVTGEEMLLAVAQDWGLSLSGFALGDGGLQGFSVTAGGQIGYVEGTAGAELFAKLSQDAPGLMPAPVNMIPLAGGVMFLPGLPAQPDAVLP